MIENKNTDVLSESDEGDPISLIPGTPGGVVVHRIKEGVMSQVEIHFCHPSLATVDARLTMLIHGHTVIDIIMPPGSVFDYGPVGVYSPLGELKDIRCDVTGSAVTVLVTGIVSVGGDGRRSRA